MDFARRAYVIRRFIQLQGLELLPLGALFLASCARGLGWFRLPGDGQPLNGTRWFVSGLAVVFAATLWSRRWYARHYGVHRQSTANSAAGPILTAAASAFAALWLQIELDLPFSLPMLLLGTALAVVGIGDFPLRGHYIGAAAVMAGLAFAAPLGVAQPARDVLIDGGIGVALWIVGVGDHVLLVTTLHDAVPLEDAAPFHEVRADV